MLQAHQAPAVLCRQACDPLPLLYSRAQSPLKAVLPQVVNQHLLADLTRAGLWTRDLKNELVAANGSVQVRCQPLHLTVVPIHRVPLDICDDQWWRACARLRKRTAWTAAAPCRQGT